MFKQTFIDQTWVTQPSNKLLADERVTHHHLWVADIRIDWDLHHLVRLVLKGGFAELRFSVTKWTQLSAQE